MGADVPGAFRVGAGSRGHGDQEVPPPAICELDAQRVEGSRARSPDVRGKGRVDVRLRQRAGVPSSAFLFFWAHEGRDSAAHAGEGCFPSVSPCQPHPQAA